MKFSELVYRGEVYEGMLSPEPIGGIDPGDLGVGEYWSTSRSVARQFGKVREKVVTLKNPLRLDKDGAFELVNKYKTVEGLLENRIQGAIQLTKDMQSAGYDGIITDGYETPEGELAINVFPDEIDEQHFRKYPRYQKYLKFMEEIGR